MPAASIYDALLREGVIVRPIAGYGMPNQLYVSVLAYHKKMTSFLLHLKKVLNLGNEK